MGTKTKAAKAAKAAKASKAAKATKASKAAKTAKTVRKSRGAKVLRASQGSRLVYPVALLITMKPLGKQSRNYDFSYWEGFYPSKKMEAMAESSLALLQGSLGSLMGGRLTIERRDRDGFIGIQISGKLSRGEIGNMMVGEFMPWSEVAETPLKKLFEAATMGAIHEMRAKTFVDSVADIGRSMEMAQKSIDGVMGRTGEVIIDAEFTEPFTSLPPDEDGALGDVEGD